MISVANSPHLFLFISYCTVSLFLVALVVHFCGGGVGGLVGGDLDISSETIHTQFRVGSLGTDIYSFLSRGNLSA